MVIMVKLNLLKICMLASILWACEDGAFSSKPVLALIAQPHRASRHHSAEQTVKLGSITLEHG